MEDNYARAYKELVEILKYVPEKLTGEPCVRCPP